MNIDFGRFRVVLWNDYRSMVPPLKQWNWIDFSFVKLACEWGRYSSSVEIGGALLGFHLLFEYWYGSPPPREKESSK